MAETQHMVMGFQSSGKTTFAAALWHLVDSREIPTVLAKGRHNGDFRYLEEIASAWAEGWQVRRTTTDEWEFIRINLLHSDGNEEVNLHFVDLSGETFERIFATREADEKVEKLLSEMNGLLLFVTAKRPKDDMSIVDIGMAIPEAMPDETDEEKAATPNPQPQHEFTPSSTPHQVQLVDLLDALTDEPISMRPSKVAVVISAWDKAPSQISPDRWLSERLPLLHQYLQAHEQDVPFRIYGVSAQGGEVPKRGEPDMKTDRVELLKKRVAGERIQIVGHGASAHDLTHPIRWLSGLES